MEERETVHARLAGLEMKFWVQGEPSSEDPWYLARARRDEVRPAPGPGLWLELAAASSVAWFPLSPGGG